MRYFLWGVLGVCVVLSGCEKKAQPAAKPIEVEVAPAAVRPVTEEFRVPAQTIAYDAVAIVARVEGYLNKRLYTEGSMVKEGQLLYEIEPEIYAADVAAAEAMLEEKKAAAQNTQREYDRQKTLLGNDATSVRKLDDALAQKLQAEAAVKHAAAELDIARRNLGYTKIHAPFSGRIGLSRISEGNLVNPATGTLTTIQKSDPMRVEFVVTETLLLRARGLNKVNREEGLELTVRLEFSDGSIYDRSGKINYWDNTINPTTGTLKLQALFDNPDEALYPGMFCRAVVTEKKPRDKLTVPLDALLNDQAGDYVYVVGDGGKVSRRTVEDGYRSRNYVVVTKNLKAGEKVVVNGIQKVRPGQIVIPVEAGEAAKPAAGTVAAPHGKDVEAKSSKPVPATPEK